MITTVPSAECHGDGHTPCPWTATGPKSNREAEKHTQAEGHVTSTHARPEGES